jgi:hypothetical protein
MQKPITISIIALLCYAVFQQIRHVCDRDAQSFPFFTFYSFKMRNFILSIVFFLCALLSSFAQSTAEKPDFLYSNKFGIIAGVIQPTVLSGGNIEATYFTKRMSFDYSHGFSLDPPAVGAFNDQNLALHLPYSTGFGIGYRFTSFLDLRFEPKLHSWEIYDKDAKQTEANRIVDFRTVTLGFGLYYRYFPFRNSENKFLQGITTATSIRYWQNVNTTLDNDEFTYTNQRSGKSETLKAPNIGLANTPVIFNIGVGYTFGGR